MSILFMMLLGQVQLQARMVLWSPVCVIVFIIVDPHP